MSQILERTMTSSEKRKDTMLKKKYDDSDMKKNMQAQYGKEEGKKVYFATIRKQAMKKEEVILERQKTNQGHRQSEEQHRSNYGKASIRNVRATGKGGNAASPDERGAAIDARHKAHKEKRGVKTKGIKEEVGISSAVRMKKAREEAMLRLKEKQAVARKMKKEEVEQIDERKREAEHKEPVFGFPKGHGDSPVRKSKIDQKTDKKNTTIKYDRRNKRSGVSEYGRTEGTQIRKEIHQAKRGDKKVKGSKTKKDYRPLDVALGGSNFYKSARKMKKEEVEVVNELSKSTLLGYVQKGTRDIATRSNDASIKGMAGKRKEADKGYEKVAKRVAGVNKAAGKLATEAAYTGPDKKDRAVINKMYDKKGNKTDFAKKAAEYEKNMDPKKRQELKDKATKGMKFTHEGTSYGLYKGSGKPGGAMKDYLDKKAKMLTKKRNKQSDAAKNNPHFDSTQPSPSGRNKYEEVQRDGYGDPIGGPKISKKQKAKNLASNTPDEQHTTTTSEAVTFQHFMEKCWKGYEKKGMKTMFGKRYPNCVKKEDVEFTDEGYGSDRVGPALKVARVIDRVNPRPKVGSKRTTISNMLKMASIKKDEKLRKQKENPYSAKNKLKMVVRSISQNARSKAGATKEEYIPEEGYDIARDMGRVRPSKDKKDGTTMPPSAEMKKTQKINKGPSALELVKKKYGKAIMDVKKK